MSKLNIGILISGRGSNMEALIRACADPAYPGRVVIVLSSRPEAPGLAKAAASGIPARSVDRKAFADQAAFEGELHNQLLKQQVDLVCLAGFMKLLSPDFIKKWTDRIINIHPSLLPDYPGLHPHDRVLADGRSESGCTVHIVTAEMDAGPVLVQRRVAVLPDDTPDRLADRILVQEHIAYPEAVCLMAQRLLKTGAG